MSKQIFRSVSLERLSSPEQLDQLMQVTTPRGWLGLAAMGGLLATAIVWSIFGNVPERIDGQGILIRSGGVLEVESPSGGRVADLAVRVGDVITEGQVVARISQQELVDRIRQTRAQVGELEAQHRRLVQFGETDAQLQAAYLGRQRANLQQSIAAGETTMRALQQKIDNEEQLVSQGLITRQALLATVQEFEGVKERVRASRSQLLQLDVEALQVRTKKEQEEQANLAKLFEARRELERLENELRTTSEVTSPYTGRVLELMTEQGSIVDRGNPILTVDLTGKAVKNLEVVVFIPSVHGKKIRPGMEIQISPSTVRKEEYGYLLGRVTYVSDFPVTPQGMQRVLKNQSLVTALSGTDAPYEVHADLLPDPSSPSTYRWSSAGGPPTRLHSGTLAAASIVVDRRRPILMVIPQLRRTAPADTARVATAARR